MRCACLVLLVLLALAAGCATAPPARPASPREALASSAVELADGAVYSLTASAVSRPLAGKTGTLFAYNGMLPGPLLKVRQGSKVSVDFRNDLPFDTTVHWHGVRLDNRFDGVTGVTQPPVKPGQTFRYELSFPDAGIYWYHPHLREDLQQELGLYGGILVEPSSPGYYNSVDREEVLFLDDLRLGAEGIEPFASDLVTYALMGRYGNTFLVNWQGNYRLQARQGETLRLFLVNAANARPLNFAVEGHSLKLVGGDSGLYEREALAEGVVLGPSERAIVELSLDRPGRFKLLNATPNASYVLGVLEVEASVAPPGQALAPHENPETLASLEPFRAEFGRAPDYEFELDLEMHGMGMADMEGMEGMMDGMMGGSTPIEWEESGMMGMMNAASNTGNTRWIIRDPASGKENMDIPLKVRQGEVKKLRIRNKADSMHPMQHPLHLHGNRFLVLSVDGKPGDNLAWKDTALVPAGSTVDLLVDFSNPGKWMLHCHIAEHLHSGMMAVFEVVP